MKKLYILPIFVIFFTTYTFSQSVSINTDGSNADASSILDIKSTDKGILIPRMSSAQRTAISSPATGLMVYDSDMNQFYYYNGTAWVQAIGPTGATGPAGPVGPTGPLVAGTSGQTLRHDGTTWVANSIIFNNGTNVGIGNSTPQARLHIGSIDNDLRLQIDHNSVSTFGTAVLLNETQAGNSDGPKIAFRKNTPNKNWSIGILNGVAESGFAINEDGSDLGFGTSRFYIGVGGNVGIGTTTPTIARLQVAGNIYPEGHYIVQNGVDGGNSRGIRMWTGGDSNWGIYMGQSGASRSFSGGTATAGGGFSAHALRFRVNNSGTQGFIFENSVEQNLFSIRGDNGRATFRGGVQFDCIGCGSNSIDGDGFSNWGVLTIQGRVLSTNSNLHLSPPNGFNVIINSQYRAAGGATGSAGLQVESLAGTGNRTVFADANGVLKTSGKAVAFSQNRGLFSHNNQNLGYRITGDPTNALNVEVGDVIFISHTSKFRWTGGSGGDHPFYGIRITGCANTSVRDAERIGTADDFPRNQWQVIATNYVWVATCNGTVQFQLEVDNNSDADDNSEYRDIVIVATRY